MKGDHYIVNGEKYFISNGIHADYITCAVRIGNQKGMKGVAFLILEKQNMRGIYCSRMKTQGWWLGLSVFFFFAVLKTISMEHKQTENSHKLKKK